MKEVLPLLLIGWYVVLSSCQECNRRGFAAFMGGRIPPAGSQSARGPDNLRRERIRDAQILFAPFMGSQSGNRAGSGGTGSGGSSGRYDPYHYLSRSKREAPLTNISQETSHTRLKRQAGNRRVEYRQMSRREMNRFHRCINNIKRTSQYDSQTTLHSPDNAPNAHASMPFLPWHRVYLNRLRNMMRGSGNQCQGVTIPYWDCTLDAALPAPHDSVLWTSRFWGRHTGTVNNGRLCPNWRVTNPCRLQGSDQLRRQIRRTGMAFCERQNILNLLAPMTFEELSSPEPGSGVSQLEGEHGRIHCYVGNCGFGRPPCGGQLGCIDCSPSDAVFYMLHSFVDCLWYEWQDLPGRINQYPPSATGAEAPNAPMRPFDGVRNRDGMQNPNFSRCRPRPGREGFQCTSAADCSTPQNLLWCSADCVCVSKVRQNGFCGNLPDRACYCRRRNQTPRNQNGRCRCV